MKSMLIVMSLVLATIFSSNGVAQADTKVCGILFRAKPVFASAKEQWKILTLPDVNEFSESISLTSSNKSFNNLTDTFSQVCLVGRFNTYRLSFDVMSVEK